LPLEAPFHPVAEALEFIAACFLTIASAGVHGYARKSKITGAKRAQVASTSEESSVTHSLPLLTRGASYHPIGQWHMPYCACSGIRVDFRLRLLGCAPLESERSLPAPRVAVPVVTPLSAVIIVK
jgi:hypothetical protein